MDDQEFDLALKTYPCPSCHQVGFLHQEKMKIVATVDDQQVVAEGEGTACGSCNSKFMSAELTESVANQVHRIKHGQGKYLEVDKNSGSIVPHSMN